MKFFRRLRIGLALLAAFCALAASGCAAEKTAPYSLQQLADIQKSGVVYIETVWTGYVQYTDNTNQISWSDELKAGGTCSGFVADPSGYIITAGHCTDPDEGKDSLITRFLASQIASGGLTSAQASELLPSALQTYRVEGPDSGEPITSQVLVYQTTASSGQSRGEPLLANVIETRGLLKGDVSLLKVQPNGPMPSLEISPEPVHVGDQVAAMGWPGSVKEVIDSNKEPSYNPGTISAARTYNGSPFIQMNADISGGMSGGPVVNAKGQVVGVVSYSPVGEAQAFNFAAGLETIRSVLGTRIAPRLSPADVEFRKGLDSYYAEDYDAARTSFRDVLQANPSHAIARQYQSDASDKSGGSGFFDLWYFWPAMAFSVVLIIVGIFLPVIKRSFQNLQRTRRAKRSMSNIACTCGSSNRQGTKFCSNCGKAVANPYGAAR